MPTQKSHAVLFTVLALASCSEDGRPPYADDGNAANGGATAPASSEPLITGDESETDGDCGLVDVEVEVLRPNFYFVLDSSDSMSEKMPDSGGISRHLAARRAIVDMLRVSGHRVNFAVSIFPDPAEDDGCAPGRTVFPLRPGEPLLSDGSDGPALEALSFNLRKYTPSGATPVSPTLLALSDELRELPTATRVFLLTDGAPNCGVAACDPEQCIPNIEEARFEGAPACDEDFNCCEQLFPHLCLDDAGVNAAIEDLSADGVETYVIGMPGSETYADVLSEMARAAGTARTDAASEYYPVADAEELASTLTTLGQQLSASCEFDLETTPLDVERVRVTLDGESLELEARNGFRWTSERSIEILGAACDDWREGAVSTLRVFEHCSGKAR